MAHVDGWGNDVPDKTLTVHEDDQTFRLRFTQKRNPIGFHARLPGDARRD